MGTGAADLAYSTYLGGSSGGGMDTGSGVAVDATGSLYVGGETDSSNFPTTVGPHGLGGDDDAFVTKFTAVAAPPTFVAPGAVWARSSSGGPLFSNWDGSTFGSTTPSRSIGTFRIMQGAEAPSRNEAIVLGVDAGGKVMGEMWNGSSWSELAINSLGNMTETQWWGFDVAYEPVSGDAMVVSTDNGSLRSWSWNGISWTGPQTLTLPVAGTPRHLELAAHPYADEMVLVVSNSDSEDYAFVWDGTTWGNSIVLAADRVRQRPH